MKTDPAIACKRKRKFKTRDSADAYAVASMVYPHAGKQCRLYVYRCDHCAGWHMTRNFHPLPESMLWPTGELRELF